VFSKNIFCLFVNWEVQTNLFQFKFLFVHWKVQSESFSNRIFVCPLESSKRIFLKSNFLKGIDVVFWPCQQSMNLNQTDLTIHFEKVQYFQSIICFFAGSFFLIQN
jgi:hypothetical protein